MLGIQSASSIHSAPPAAVQAKEPPKSIVQKVKEVVQWIWKAIVIAVTAALTQFNFVAFRILNFIHPSIGPQLEIFYLRISGIVDAIRYGWKKEEIAELRRSHENLRVKVEEQAPYVANYPVLHRENERLKEEKKRLEETNGFLTQNTTAFQKQNESLLRETQLVGERESALRLEKETLLHERDALSLDAKEIRQHLESAQAAYKELQAKFQLLARSLPSLADHAKTAKAMEVALARLPHPSKTMDQSELDDILNSLLPLLLKQLENAKKPLGLAKEQFSTASPQWMALLNVERILGEIGKLLGKIPKAMQQHANWENPAAAFLNNQWMEV